MNQFICIMKPTKPKTADAPKYSGAEAGKIFGQHGAFLKKMAGEGTVIFAGYTMGENPGALSLAVLNAKSAHDAETIMRAAPAVSAGLLTADITEFDVFVSTELRQG